MLNEADARTLRAAEAIVGYLERHPAAADNETGIAQWWLPSMGVDVPIINVRDALDRLVQRGQLSRDLLPGAGAIYRRGPPAAP